MKAKQIFYCTECGNEFPKWNGRCPACGQWNTITEEPVKSNGNSSDQISGMSLGYHAPKALGDIETRDELRFPTGMYELDRVLGGGAVRGSLVLIGGAPGIGKSTLMLQICRELCRENKVLYASGEESARQIKLRAERLKVKGERLYLQSETRLSAIIEAVHAEKPDVLIVDSIQTMCIAEADATPGSVSQVKQCTTALMNLAKSNDLTIFVISHINKEGSIAGPKVLEHMVDCVLYFEGGQHTSYRMLRAIKNRFGTTNEIGVFEMLKEGLKEVPNPSEMLLSARPEHASGTCVTCVMEGNRPILAEIQALVTSTSYSVPRRTSNGIDYNRAALLMAVLEKRGGLNIGGCDIYINVVGGLILDEPGADLSTVLALASSFRDKPLPDDLVALGEIGLTGELRSISGLEQRLTEISRLGFTKVLIPAHSKIQQKFPGLKLIPIKNIREALAVLLA